MSFPVNPISPKTKEILDNLIATTITDSPCIHDWIRLSGGPRVCRHCEVEVSFAVYEQIRKQSHNEKE